MKLPIVTQATILVGPPALYVLAAIQRPLTHSVTNWWPPHLLILHSSPAYQSNCLQLDLLIDYELLNPFCFGALVSRIFYRNRSILYIIIIKMNHCLSCIVSAVVCHQMSHQTTWNGGVEPMLSVSTGASSGSGEGLEGEC